PQFKRYLFARSPGYAWGRFEWDDNTTEGTVELAPGGDLCIVLAGDGRDPKTMIRLYPAGSTVPLADLALRRGRVLSVAAPPAGELEVKAEIGAREVGHASATIVAGTRTSVELALEGTEAPRWEPLEGTLLLPPQWGLADFRLWFSLPDESQAESG